MKNKIDLKKALITSICVIMLWIVSSGIFNIYQYKVYTNNINTTLNGITQKIVHKYPNVDKTELVEVLNSDKSYSNGILREYGIDLEKDSIIEKNEKDFKMFFAVNIIILLLLSVSLLIVFWRYNKTKDKKLYEITQYIEEINRKNYKLDIDDNTEDELSILKNEIYKTTIMLKEQAENSMKDKVNLKDSISDISHQLKTPLTSIIILLDNIIDNPHMDNVTRNDFIKNIKREITNINFLVQALLKLAKFDSNTIKFTNRQVKVVEILNEAIDNVSVLCDLKNINIEISGNDDITINCDMKWQIEAISNILKNSVEYSNDYSTVKILYIQNRLYSEIRIIDNGKGIYEEEIPHIFERFYKGRNSSKESSGIGLALSKTIIEQNNGSVSVESKIGEGTIFIIKYFK